MTYLRLPANLRERRGGNQDAQVLVRALLRALLRALRGCLVAIGIAVAVLANRPVAPGRWPLGLILLLVLPSGERMLWACAA
ncbi:MAG TPA: hypothetical protein VG860_19925 [Terriglobia bacterium]|jgi:hypothetical protein|nr:hypothetical protein [Terriglobia bacterium]